MLFSKRRKIYNDPNNEHVIEVVHREEASPAMLTRLFVGVLFVLLAAATIGQQLYFQGQRSSDQKAQSARDAQFKTDQEALNVQVQAQIAAANADRTRLRNLFIGFLTAKTPADARKLLEEFTKQLAASPSPMPIPSPTRSSRSRRTTQPSPQPSPHPSRTPAPKPTPTHKPSPSPSPTDTCLVHSPADGHCVIKKPK